jgi:hypothetical protein
MARISNGFLGNASGKLGNVVFSKWKEIYTARQYQPDIHDANSQAQQKQRSRMVSLLQFLKPLNKNFIKFFNTPFAKGSTPWAIAIHDNMKIVSPDGCVSLQNFSLGEPKYPPFEIFDVSYNPFTNQTHFQYKKPNADFQNDPFPYFAPCVLGKYKSDSGLHEFDIRHLLCSLPEGHFWCSIYEGFDEHVYDNSWSGTRFWMIYYDSYDVDKIINPALNVSAPVYFEAAPTLEGFNTNINDNLVPVDAITWEYKQGSSDWYLDFYCDFSKTELTKPSDYTLIFWFNALTHNNHYFQGPYEWDLQESSFESLIGAEGFNGSIIALYAIFNKKGEQVSAFNRFYIEKGSDSVVFPYFEQLFKCKFSHPASFVLSGNQCGFCGNIDTLFNELFSLWEQGFVPEEENPLVIPEANLKLKTSSNGVVLVHGQIREEEQDFVFEKNKMAELIPKPEAQHVFSTWKGDDAEFVVDLGNDTFQIQMSKERVLIPEFVPNT